MLEIKTKIEAACLPWVPFRKFICCICHH